MHRFKERTEEYQKLIDHQGLLTMKKGRPFCKMVLNFHSKREWFSSSKQRFLDLANTTYQAISKRKSHETAHFLQLKKDKEFLMNQRLNFLHLLTILQNMLLTELVQKWELLNDSSSRIRLSIKFTLTFLLKIFEKQMG